MLDERAACASWPPTRCAMPVVRLVQGDYGAHSYRLSLLQDYLVWGPVVDSIHLRATTVEGDFAEWWSLVVRTAFRQLCKGTSSLIMLTTWGIWKHRNVAVFDKCASLGGFPVRGHQGWVTPGRTWGLGVFANYLLRLAFLGWVAWRDVGLFFINASTRVFCIFAKKFQQ
jgi:hypothetical protein